MLTIDLQEMCVRIFSLSFVRQRWPAPWESCESTPLMTQINENIEIFMRKEIVTVHFRRQVCVLSLLFTQTPQGVSTCLYLLNPHLR